MNSSRFRCLRRFAAVAGGVLLPLTARAQTAARPPAIVAPAPGTALSAIERTLAARVSAQTIREITTTLAAPGMEGRGVGQPGGEKAAAYLEGQFRRLGLTPGGDANRTTFRQTVPFRFVEVLPGSGMRGGDGLLASGKDVAFATLPLARSAVSGNVVFAGYGVVAPDLKRDDLAGADLTGKIALVVNGLAAPPPNVDPQAWMRVADTLTVTKNLLGRGAVGIAWTNLGATGNPTFAQLADYLNRPRLSPGSSAPAGPFGEGPPQVFLSDAGAEKLFANSGTTYAAAKATAEAGIGKPLDLKTSAAITVNVRRSEPRGDNIVGLLEGSDPQLKQEAVVFSAHYDGFGKDAAGRVFPGAADNALGVAEMVAIAEAFAKAPPAERPRRSLIFLAVTGEEAGLLGSGFWVRNPTWPLARIAANVNFDGIGTETYGPVKRVVGYGADQSSLGTVFAGVARATGREVWPDPLPEERVFFRSDHFEFVKRGIPALMLLGGPAGDPATLLARVKKWLATDYHQPTDTARPDWDWDGARQITSIALLVGRRVANQTALPVWNPTSPYNRPRGAAFGPPPGRP